MSLSQAATSSDTPEDVEVPPLTSDPELPDGAL